MARLVIAGLALLIAASVRAGEGVSGGASFSIGPSGVSFGGAPELGIRNDGNGVYSMSFSVSGAVNRAIGAGDAGARVLPPIQIGPSSGVLTDSATFFRGVGRGAARPEAAPSRRPRAPGR